MLDLKAFLQQRKELQLIPQYMLTSPEDNRDTWKSPLGFALQALTLQVVISSLLLFPLLLFPRSVAHLVGLPTGIKQVHPRSIIESDCTLPFGPIWSNYDKFIKSVGETMPEIDDFTQAIALAASAYAFGKVLGKRSDTVSNDQAERVLLYFVPAVTFAPNVLHSIVQKLSTSLRKIEVPAAVYAPYVQIINILLLVYFFVLLYKSRSMLDVLFTTPSVSNRSEAYWTLVKVIIIASVVASLFISCSAATLVYAKLVLGELAE